MNRTSAISVVFLGGVISALGYSGISPHLRGLGIFVIVLGVLFLMLSFVPLPDPGDESAMPVFDRLTKIFYSPSEVFRSFRTHPRWIAAILVMGVFTGVYEYAFVNRLTPERIADHNALRQTERGTSTPIQVEEARKQAIETDTNPVARAGSFVGGFVGRTLVMIVMGLLILGLIKILSGSINLWQAFSVAAYSLLPVIVISRGLSLILLFFRDPAGIHPVFGSSGIVPDSLNFLVSPMESPGPYRIISYFSILGFYWLWLAVTGLRNAGEDISVRNSRIAGVILWVIGFLLVAIPSMIG